MNFVPLTSSGGRSWTWNKTYLTVVKYTDLVQHMICTLTLLFYVRNMSMNLG